MERDIPRLDVEAYRRIRRFSGISAAKLAERAGMLPDQLHAVVSGRRLLRLGEAAALAAVLAVPIDALLYIPSRLRFDEEAIDDQFLRLPASLRHELARSAALRSPESEDAQAYLSTPDLPRRLLSAAVDHRVVRDLLTRVGLSTRAMALAHDLPPRGTRRVLLQGEPISLALAVTVARLARVRYAALTPGVPLEAAGDLACAGWRRLDADARELLVRAAAG